MNTSRNAILSAGVLPLMLASCGMVATAPTTTAIPDTAAPTATLTPLPTATASPTPTPTPTPSPTATPHPGLGTLLLGYRYCGGSMCSTGNTNLNGGSAIRISLPRTFSEGGDPLDQVVIGDGQYLLLDVSPDYQSLLLSAGPNLYVSDLEGKHPDLITTNFVNSIEITAFWMQSGSIVYIGNAGAQKYIYLVQPDGSGPHRITDAGMKPYRLVPSGNVHGILWEAGDPYPGGGGVYSEGMRWTTIEGKTLVELRDTDVADVSPFADVIAHPVWQYEFTTGDSGQPVAHLTGGQLVLLDVNTQSTREVPLPLRPEHCGMYYLKWTPDGRNLLPLLTLCETDPQGGEHLRGHQPVMVDPEGGAAQEYPESSGFLQRQGPFSPDGERFLLFGFWTYRTEVFLPPEYKPPPVIRHLLSADVYTVDAAVSSWFRLAFDWPVYVQRAVWVPAGIYPADPTATPAPTRTPRPTQEVDYPYMVWFDFFEDVLRPIFRDADFLADLQDESSDLRRDPYIESHFGSLTVIQDIAMICGQGSTCVSLGPADFEGVPLDETCRFIERHYVRYGWPVELDRSLVLVRLVEMLGSPDPESEYPYCANFDPAQNPGLSLPPTATPTRRPTRTAADPGS